jgi:uncharacterized protein YjbJ (UPF0337 family)
MVRRARGTVRVHDIQEKVNDVGAEDKASNAAQDVAGKAKEAAGEMRGDRPQKNAGKREQRKADLKKAAEHVKDAGKK